jgi:hypothetical protein
MLLGYVCIYVLRLLVQRQESASISRTSQDFFHNFNEALLVKQTVSFSHQSQNSATWPVLLNKSIKLNQFNALYSTAQRHYHQIELRDNVHTQLLSFLALWTFLRLRVLSFEF